MLASKHCPIKCVIITPVTFFFEIVTPVTKRLTHTPFCSIFPQFIINSYFNTAVQNIFFIIGELEILRIMNVLKIVMPDLKKCCIYLLYIA